MKALIVDDDVYVRLCMLRMIEWQSLGFSQVLEADNGATALEIALREKPDLIKSDVNMPFLGGLELSKQLHKDIGDTCVIILSEYYDFEFVQKAMGCGVQDYFLKPITRERLAEISERIRQAAVDLKKRRYYTALVTDGTYIKELAHKMLTEMDADAALKTLEDAVHDAIHIDDLKRFCLMFIGELFSQMEAATLRTDELSDLRHSSFSHFSGLKNVTDMLSFTGDLCRRCLTIGARQVSPTESYVKQMMDYIEQHYADPDLSVAKISDMLHLSTVYTGSLFKKYRQCSMLSHIHQVRMRHAKEMLADSTLTISEIGSRVGYLTPDYFTRVFRQAVGMTPSEYQVKLQSTDVKHEE